MRTFLRRLGTALLFLLVALCFAPSLVPPFLDRIYYEGPPSGHFDGARFFNPDERARPRDTPPTRFFNRWLTGDGRANWPDQVPVSPSVPPRRVEGQRMLVTWIGHSTVLVQTNGLNILTDPIWSDRASPFSFAGPKRVRAPGVRFEDLPKIDLVLVSHNHYDHMDLPTLHRLVQRFHPRIVAGLGNAAFLKKAGIAGATDVDWWQSVELPGGVRLTGVPAVHWSARSLTDRGHTLWLGFVLESPATGRVYFAGDTGYGELVFSMIHQRFTNSTRLAPSFSRRATSASMSSLSMSKWTREG